MDLTNSQNGDVRKEYGATLAIWKFGYKLFLTLLCLDGTSYSKREKLRTWIIKNKIVGIRHQGPFPTLLMVVLTLLKYDRTQKRCKLPKTKKIHIPNVRKL